MSIFFPAGAELISPIHAAMLTFADRALLTAYPHVTKLLPPDGMSYLLRGFGSRPLILDSGVFSLVQRSRAGEEFTDAFIIDYFDKYLRFVKDMKFPGVIVEMDCHLLCPSWKTLLASFRKVLNEEFGDRVLYAYHPIRGNDDFPEMLERCKRIALRPKDIAKYTGSTISQGTRALMLRAGKMKERIHWHTLGDVSPHSLALPNNFSCDSSTWSMIVRFGRTLYNTPYAVTWWRRQKLEAPKCVVDIVEAKMDELFKNYWGSPTASRTKPEPKYTVALSYALVAAQLYARSHSIRLPGRKFAINPEVHVDGLATLT